MVPNTKPSVYKSTPAILKPITWEDTYYLKGYSKEKSV